MSKSCSCCVKLYKNGLRMPLNTPYGNLNSILKVVKGNKYLWVFSESFLAEQRVHWKKIAMESMFSKDGVAYPEATEKADERLEEKKELYGTGEISWTHARALIAANEATDMAQAVAQEVDWREGKLYRIPTGPEIKEFDRYSQYAIDLFSELIRMEYKNDGGE